MDKNKYEEIIKIKINNGNQDFKTRLAMTSISKESKDITMHNGMPKDMARLYLSSDIRDLLIDKGGNTFVVDSFFKEDGFIDIIINEISIPFKEKVQLHSMWGDNYFALYHGIEAPTITLSGVMYNSRNNDWWDDFINIYLEMLRGSELSKLEQTVCLNYYTYNNIFFSILSFQSGVRSDNQNMVGFGLSGIVHAVKVAKNKQYSPSLNETLVARELAQANFPSTGVRWSNNFSFKYEQYYAPSTIASSSVSDKKEIIIEK